MPRQVHKPAEAPGKRKRTKRHTGKPSTVTTTPAEIAYRWEPLKLAKLPRDVSLSSVDDADIIRAIDCGLTMSEIARDIGRDIGALSRYLAQPQRSSRVKEARRLSAIYWDEQAQQVLMDLPKDATNGQIARARELASHYRWRAKSIAPQDYGDRPALDGEAEAARQAQALSTEAARLVLSGVMAAVGYQLAPLPRQEQEAIPGESKQVKP